ncbi:MAG: septum site-determining protein MinC [Stappiaceae bacterium]
MTIAVKQRQKMRFRGKSFLAMVLTPDLPIGSWLAEVDRILSRSPGFFVGRPIVLDCSSPNAESIDFPELLALLGERGIQVMGIEGISETTLGPGMPPVITGGRSAGDFDPAEDKARKSSPRKPFTPREPEPKARQTSGLLIDQPVRSGQSIVFPDGDVTIIGSVSSGAEVIAGGSVHVYGALRGRAMAGTTGADNARIFCSKLDAELVAINGLYKTAEDIGPDHLKKSVQIQLEFEDLIIVNL